MSGKNARRLLCHGQKKKEFQDLLIEEKSDEIWILWHWKIIACYLKQRKCWYTEKGMKRKKYKRQALTL